MDLSLAFFVDSGWTEAQADQHTSELNRIFGQCQVHVGQIQFHHLTSPSLPRRLVSRNPEHQDSIERLAELLSWLRKPALYMIEGVAESTPSTPFSKDQFKEMNGAEVPDSIQGTIWLPSYINTPAYAKEREKSPYSVLAHELTHILTLDGQHNNDKVPNILTIWKRRTNLITQEQCAEIRVSPYLHAKKTL